MIKKINMEAINMFVSPKLSLCDLIGEDYFNAVHKTYKYLHNEKK